MSECDAKKGKGAKTARVREMLEMTVGGGRGFVGEA